MKMEKKQIVKEDGRYLVYYHFPDTASEEQTHAFETAAAAGGEASASSPDVKSELPAPPPAA